MGNNISRRDFLKITGIAGLATAGLSACSDKNTGAATPRHKSGEMTYRVNPSTGDKVSLLGYGMMRLPTMADPNAKPGGNDKDGVIQEVIDQESVNDLVDYALAHGVNYFDTSPVYCQGRSEESTGIALSRHPRDKYFIATKLSNFSPETQTYDASVAMYRNSLKNLRTDHLDYLLLHAIGGGDDSIATFNQRFIDNGVLEFLQKEREAGRIRNLGWSFHGDVKAFDHLLKMHDEGKAKWDFVQIQLNYVDWKHASERNVNAEYLYNELAKRNIPAVIMEPLLGGRLATLADFLNARLKERRPEESVASWAFRFAGTPQKVLTVLSGMTYKEHLVDNLNTFCPLEPCTPAELELLEDTAVRMQDYETIPCTACQYCMPCPFGLDIPRIFRHYNKCVNEGNVIASADNEGYRKARKAFLVGYDRSVPRLRQANHCIGCGQCEPHCPQNIHIPDQLHRIDKFVEQLKQS